MNIIFWSGLGISIGTVVGSVIREIIIKHTETENIVFEKFFYRQVLLLEIAGIILLLAGLLKYFDILPLPD